MLPLCRYRCRRCCVYVAGLLVVVCRSPVLRSGFAVTCCYRCWITLIVTDCRGAVGLELLRSAVAALMPSCRYLLRLLLLPLVPVCCFLADAELPRVVPVTLLRYAVPVDLLPLLPFLRVTALFGAVTRYVCCVLFTILRLLCLILPLPCVYLRYGSLLRLNFALLP